MIKRQIENFWIKGQGAMYVWKIQLLTAYINVVL